MLSRRHPRLAAPTRLRPAPPAVVMAAVASALLATALLTPAAQAATTKTDIDTTPSQAEVYLVTPEGTEQPLGITPLDNVRLPRGLVTVRFRKEGYRDLVENIEITRSAQSFVFTLVREIKPASLELMSQPQYHGAAVVIDGKAEGTLPTTLSVPPGRHQAVVTKEGYGRWERWIDVGEGQRVTFDVVLVPEVRPRGSILVTSSPSGAEVRLNGSPRGPAPVAINDLTPGEYLVELFLADHAPFSQSVVVPEGGQVVVDGRLTSTIEAIGEIKVLVDVDTATVFIDGENLGMAPVVKSNVVPGLHQVEAKAEGHVGASQEVTVRPGESVVVKLSLLDATARAGSTIRIVSNVSDATVSLDGGPPQAVPIVLEDVASGTHFVRVEAPGYSDWEKQLLIEPGTRTEVVAELFQVGRLEVRTKLPTENAEVFIDNALVGRTPLIHTLKTGTYSVLIKRSDGEVEEHDIAVGLDAPVVITADFGADEKKRGVEHRAMPYSAQVIDIGYGTLDLEVGWPYIIGARVNGGIYKNMELGFTFRNSFDALTEFEGRFKYMLLRSRAFGVAGETSLGGGGGTNGRNSFTWRLRALGSILINERVAITARIGFMVFSDGISSEHEALPAGQTAKRDTGLGFTAGLAVEFRVSKYWNCFVKGTAMPARTASDTRRIDGRLILEEGVAGGAKNLSFRASVGCSLLF